MGFERVVVLTAMVQEMRPVRTALGLRRQDLGDVTAYRGRARGVDIVAAVTGMGTGAARRVTDQVLDCHHPDHVLVVGIAGSVDPELPIGSLVSPESVVDGRTGTAYRPVPNGTGVARGTLLTSDELVTGPGALEVLRQRGIVAVDMETAAVGAACERRDVAWSVFRAISDRAGDPATDTSVMGLAHPDGSADVAAVVRFLLQHPRRIPHLVTLGRGSHAATRAAGGAAVAWLASR